MMNKLFVLLVAALAWGCSTSAPEPSSRNRALVRGVATGNTRVLIRSVDGGEVLWTGGYRLGDKVWLQPGRHRLALMCETRDSRQRIVKGAEVELEVEAGYTYSLSVNPLRSVADNPQVSVTTRKGK